MTILEKVAERCGQKAADDLVRKFWKRVDKCPTHWWWLGAQNLQGYGIFTISGYTITIHRLSWEIANGVAFPMPVARHSCDLPFCVRPEHIIPGTYKDNARDCVERQQTGWARKERMRFKWRMQKWDRKNLGNFEGRATIRATNCLLRATS